MSKQMNAVGIHAGTTKATNWLRTEIPKLGLPKRAALMKDAYGNSPRFGTLNLFFYDPKLKQKLPYYDAFPLALYLEGAAGGFLGLNMHYLPINMRVMLLDKLMDFSTDKTLTENSRLAASYSVLKGVARYRAFKPCIKHYLDKHIQSNVLAVPATQWEMVCMLPVENFQKMGKGHVWADSQAKMDDTPGMIKPIRAAVIKPAGTK